MKLIESKVGYVHTEYFIFDLLDEEPVLVDLKQQIDDLIVNLEGGDVLLSWDRDEWDDGQCVLLKERDNMKEISNLKCSHILFKRRAESPVKVYLTLQRN